MLLAWHCPLMAVTPVCNVEIVLTITISGLDVPIGISTPDIFINFFIPYRNKEKLTLP